MNEKTLFETYANIFQEEDFPWTTIDTSYNISFKDISALTWNTQFNEDYLNKCIYGWQIFDTQNQLFWGSIISEEYKERPTETDQIIDASYARLSSKTLIENLLYCTFEQVDKEEEFEIEVAKKFKDINKVDLIYVDTYMGSKRFKIFTSNKKYDDELMDRLLDIECEMKLKHLGELPLFEYIPKIYQDLNEIIRDDAKLIYKRGRYVLFTRPSYASQEEREASLSVA